MLGVTASSCKIVNGHCIEWKKSNFLCCQGTSPQDIIMHSPLHSSIILLLAASSGDSYSRCWCMRCSNTNIWWQRNEENVSRKSIKRNRVLVRGCSDIFCPRCERWEQKVDHHQRWELRCPAWGWECEEGENNWIFFTFNADGDDEWMLKCLVNISCWLYKYLYISWWFMLKRVWIQC